MKLAKARLPYSLDPSYSQGIVIILARFGIQAILAKMITILAILVVILATLRTQLAKP